VIKLQLVEVEDDVLVNVEEEVLVVLETALPFIEAEEAIAEDEDGRYLVFADLVDGFLCPGEDGVGVEVDHAGFVDKPVHGDDVFVAVLCEEDRELVVHVEPAVAVLLAVGTVEPPDYALTSRMIPSVLAAWRAVQVEVHAETVLARVLDTAQKIAP